jgi:hypothetical protein
MAKNVSKKDNRDNKPENGGKQYFNLDAENAFFEEVDEEVRNEKFKQLINKYGGIIMFILIVALSVAVGYEKIGEWRNLSGSKHASDSPKAGGLYIAAISSSLE